MDPHSSNLCYSRVTCTHCFLPWRSSSLGRNCALGAILSTQRKLEKDAILFPLIWFVAQVVTCTRTPDVGWGWSKWWWKSSLKINSPSCKGVVMDCVHPGVGCISPVFDPQEGSPIVVRKAVANWSPQSQPAQWQWDESGTGYVDRR